MSTGSIQKKKRIPKEGCWFTGIRVVAFLAKLLGGLTLLGGVVGFISTFIKTVPGIFSALQNLDQGFALFVLTLIATYFGVFAGLGCVGIITIGLGFLMDFISSKPNEENFIDKPSPLA
jgi:hypothetical protein